MEGFPPLAHALYSDRQAPVGSAGFRTKSGARWTGGMVDPCIGPHLVMHISRYLLMQVKLDYLGSQKQIEQASSAVLTFQLEYNGKQ